MIVLVMIVTVMIVIVMKGIVNSVVHRFQWQSGTSMCSKAELVISHSIANPTLEPLCGLFDMNPTRGPHKHRQCKEITHNPSDPGTSTLESWDHGTPNGSKRTLFEKEASKRNPN